MNYPVWEIYTFGGGFFIAFIAIVHVYVAHFAIGGGLFLVLTEMKGHRENSEQILEYTRRHTKFFLLLTLVFGSITGVGIWFTIALISPAATSSLIHTFVFGWATEWVCFAGEIVALFIYFYTFGKMDKKAHVKIGWLYFIFAWLSLFFINGIIGFMLTPGKWIETGNFWHGFFNPTFWPSLIFRTTLALIFAGIFGFVTSTFLKDDSFRKTMVQYCAKWLLFPFLFMVISAFWYLKSMPMGSETMIVERSHEIKSIVLIFITVSSVLFISALFMAIRAPETAKKPIAFALLFIGLLYMGSFEWIREAVRRPYLIYNVLYSNSIFKSDLKRINEQGILKTAKWVHIKEINDNNALDAGKDIFKLACLSCHSVKGPMNDIMPLTKKFSVFGMEATLDGMGKLNPYMPVFAGTRAEKSALSRYIVEGLHKNHESPHIALKKSLEFQMPGFDDKTDQYVLLSWNSKGMHFFSDSDKSFSLIPPGNTLYACLIKRGEIPERVFDDIEISYFIEKGFGQPSKQVSFWEFSQSLIGKKLDKDKGISGNPLQGTMKLDESGEVFSADHLPVVPYSEEGSFNPYPLITIEAKDKTTGQILARTKTVAPASTEMGCKNCHGGNWKVLGVTGIAQTAASDILSTHDKNSKTNLRRLAKRGLPVSCKSCHIDSTKETAKNSGRLNLSAAVHGWHANYLPDRGADACYNCHPDSPNGTTRSFRGYHAGIFDCTACHGAIEDHALSLLKAELGKNKKGALRLMKHLKPQMAKTVDEINPRIPWVNEPDCLNCHIDFQLPDNDDFSAFNQWTSVEEDLFRHRHDDMYALRCTSCHGSPHAVYPAASIFGNARDNIQPMQYQKSNKTLGSNNCKPCHTVPMEDEAHHVNSLK